jgi:hypothetical protein
MTKSEEEGGGGRRAEWVSDAGGASSVGLGNGAAQGPKTVAWIWWRRPEEWADVLVDWVEGTGQKGSVLTVYELIHGEGAMSQGTIPLLGLWVIMYRVVLIRVYRVPWHGYGCHAALAECLG